MRQEKETDIGFMQKTAALEGGALILFDNRMILASESYLEGRGESVRIPMDGAYLDALDRSGLGFGSA